MTNQDSKQNLEWLYGGPSSIIDRDDYLSGRKIDKNFELFGDTIKKDAASKIEALSRRDREPIVGKVSSLLDLDTIRKEDPLVAVKVQEEKARREMFENPIKLKQLQKIILKTMEKKLTKELKKKRKHARDESKASSSSSDNEKPSRSRRRSQSSTSRERTHSRRRLYSDRHSLSTSMPSSSRHSGDPSNSNRKHRHKKDSTSDLSPDPRRKSGDSKQGCANKDAKYKSSDDDGLSFRRPSCDSDLERPQRKRHYGLVVVKEKPKEERKDYRKDMMYELPRSRKNVPLPQSSSWQPPKEKRKLTAEERQKLLDEMQDNAKWRDEQRSKNVKRLEMAEKLEADELQQSTEDRGQLLARSLRLQAADGQTVADRVKSNVHKIQRSSEAMHSNFARK